MDDEIVLNNFEPSVELVREWGYSEDMCFIEQDEDLALHDARYVSILLELAADDSCPKNDYALSILTYFSQLALLSRRTETVELISRTAAASVKSNPKIEDWKRYFQQVRERLINPKPLDASEIEMLAKQLLVGIATTRDFKTTGHVVDGYAEFMCYTESYAGYVYIHPETGIWRRSNHSPLTEIA